MKPSITPAASSYLKQLFLNGNSIFDDLADTDPEFLERFANFAFDEVISTGAPAGQKPLDDRTRFLSALATLIGCQGAEAFKALLGAALEADVSPIAIKEVVYQSVAYMGFGRMAPFLGLTNSVLAARGVELPLKGQATIGTDPSKRIAAGEAKQVEFFGAGMKGFASSGNPAYPQINRWLSANCFGDWYTRGGLTGAERELVTFCLLAAQGGTEPQLISHARANMSIGNSSEILFKVISANVAWIGYPRTLNAIRCVEQAAG